MFKKCMQIYTLCIEKSVDAVYSQICAHRVFNPTKKSDSWKNQKQSLMFKKISIHSSYEIF